MPRSLLRPSRTGFSLPVLLRHPRPAAAAGALALVLLVPVARGDLAPDPAVDGDNITMLNDGDTIDLDGFNAGTAINLTVDLVAGDDVQNAAGDALWLLEGSTVNVAGSVSGDVAIHFGNATGSNTLNLQAGGALTGTGGTAVLGGAGDETVNFDTTASVTGAIDLGGGSNSLAISGNGTIAADLLNVGTVTATNNAGTLTLSGDGSGTTLTKSGTGSLALTGDHDYSGGVVVSGGDLYVGLFGTTGSLVADVGLNTGSTLAFLRTDNTTFAGDISGGGNVLKAGNGTLTLSGNNSWTGMTAVWTGTLLADGGAAIGDASAVSVLAGATLALGANETVGSLTGAGTLDTGGFVLTSGGDDTSTAFTGVVTGTGGVAKAGTGTLTLSGSNSYSGVTQVNAGTLQASGGTAIGDLSAVSVASGASLVLDAAETIGSLAGAGSVDNGGFLLTAGGNDVSTTFSGVLSGSGGLAKQGTGTFTLMGTNTFSGDVAVDGGTLAVAGGAAIDDLAAVSLASGTLLAMGGNETIGSLSGAGNVNNGGFALTTGGDDTSTTFSGAMSGSGSLVKNGSGTLTLTGNNAWSGGTTINSGALFVGNGGTSGAITGPVTNNGAILFNRSDDSVFNGAISGSGTITKSGAGMLTLGGVSAYTGLTTVTGGALRLTGVLLNSDVEVLAGARIEGTGSANGLLMNPGSTFTVHAASNGVADKLTISGPVSIAGATVNVLADPAGTWSYTTAFTIIDSSGGITGTFANVVTDLVFLDPSLGYTGGDVILTLARNDVGFDAIARNGNEFAVATALASPAANAPGSGLLPLVTSLTGLSLSDSHAALASLNGQSLANIGQLAMGMWDTVRGWHEDHRVRAAQDSKAPGSIFDEYIPETEWPTVWAHVDGAQLDAATQPGAAGYAGDRSGMVVGIDYALDDGFGFGLSLAQVNDDITYEYPGDHAELAATFLTLRTVGKGGPLLWSAQLGVGRAEAETRRVIHVGSATRFAEGDTDSSGLHFYADVAWPLQAANIGVAPMLGLAASRVSVQEFSEAGVLVAGLGVESAAYTGFSSHLGARLRWPAQGGALAIEANAAWVHEFADTEPTLDVYFAEVPSAVFNVYGTELDADAIRAGVRATASLRNKLSVYAEANGNWRGDISQQGIVLGLSKDW